MNSLHPKSVMMVCTGCGHPRFFQRRHVREARAKGRCDRCRKRQEWVAADSVPDRPPRPD